MSYSLPTPYLYSTSFDPVLPYAVNVVGRKTYKRQLKEFGSITDDFIGLALLFSKACSYEFPKSTSHSEEPSYFFSSDSSTTVQQPH
jgi:hypothetical protein